MAYQPTTEDKSSGMLCHLLCAFTAWLGPLIILKTKKDATPFVKLQAKQTLVWGIAMIIPFVAAAILTAVFNMVNLGIIGRILYLAVLAFHLYFTITGTIKTNKGEKFIYPVLTERFCKAEMDAVYA
jgi:hypothetical protein